MSQKSKYEIAQTKKQLDLLQHSDLFDNAPAGGLCLLKDEKR